MLFDELLAGREEYEVLEEVGHGTFSEVGGGGCGCGVDGQLEK